MDSTPLQSYTNGLVFGFDLGTASIGYAGLAMFPWGQILGLAD